MLLRALLALTAGLALISACTKEMKGSREPVNLDPHHITVEQAIKTMNSAMAQLYSGTRAVTKNYSIQTIKGRDLHRAGWLYGAAETNSGSGTRAAEGSAGEGENGTTQDGSATENQLPEDLLYIVNFDDNQGFAVLAADDRIDPVLAITESGSISTNVFTAEPVTNQADLTPDAIIGELIASYIVTIANSAPGGNFQYWWENNPDMPERKKVAPLLNTKWGQSKPYNLLCPYIVKKTVTMGVVSIDTLYASTGCHATATAQIIAYHEKPALSTYGISGITWAQIKNTDYTKPRNNSNRNYYDAIASIMRQIGDGISMSYTIGSSETNILSAYRYFQDSIHYSAANLALYSENIILYELDHRRPIQVRGQDNTELVGHAWVIDGYIGYLNHNTGVYDVNLSVHCNWGFDGSCDGYFASRIFSINDVIYNTDLEILTLKP